MLSRFADSMEPLLQVRGLTVSYRSDTTALFPAVKEVSFDLVAGRVLGLMGESGCGKSSITHALLGLLPRDRAEVIGSAFFRGTDLITLGERDLQRIRGAAISTVYQDPEIALNPVMRAGDQVAEVIRAHVHLPWKDCRAQARAMIERVGLREVNRIYAAYPHQLSGGQRQRIVLAQALACNPAIVIADEPTAHLDASSQSEFLDLLESVTQDSCTSVLLISHTPETQARLADWLLVMKAGRIVEEGRFVDLHQRSTHPYTRSILGLSIPLREEDELLIEERAIR